VADGEWGRGGAGAGSGGRIGTLACFWPVGLFLRLLMMPMQSGRLVARLLISVLVLPSRIVSALVATLGGTTRRDALLLDAEAALQFALSRRGLNVKRRHVVVVGHSIGGAVGTIVAASSMYS
jgi:hypothetical protein